MAFSIALCRCEETSSFCFRVYPPAVKVWRQLSTFLFFFFLQNTIKSSTLRNQSGRKVSSSPRQTQLCLSMITDLIKLRLFVDKWATLITINLLSLQNGLPSRSKLREFQLYKFPKWTKRTWEVFPVNVWMRGRDANGFVRISLGWYYSSLSQMYPCSKSFCHIPSTNWECFILLQSVPSEGSLSGVGWEVKKKPF